MAVDCGQKATVPRSSSIQTQRGFPQTSVWAGLVPRVTSTKQARCCECKAANGFVRLHAHPGHPCLGLPFVNSPVVPRGDEEGGPGQSLAATGHAISQLTPRAPRALRDELHLVLADSTFPLRPAHTVHWDTNLRSRELIWDGFIKHKS